MNQSHVKKLILTSILMSLFSTATKAALNDDIANLKNQYQAEYAKAGQRGAYSTSAFRLAFSVDQIPERERVGNILLAIDLQDQALSELSDDREQLPLAPKRPGNDVKTNGGLVFVELNIARDCRHCKTLQERIAYAKAAHDLLEIYDIQAAGARSARSNVKFSGLPFFNLVAQRFADPLFQSRTISFYNELSTLTSRLASHPASDPNAKVVTNVNEIALKVCHGDQSAATELAGILLSRDSNIIKYFHFLPKLDPIFVSSASKIPLLVQLIAELDKVQTGAVRDRFSFDGLYEVNDARNYYFWSGALVAEELRKRGASSEDIKELNLQFARHYKILRWYEEQAKRAVSLLTGKGLPPLNQENHDLHAFRTMRITGAGVRLERTNSCPALFGN